MDEPYRLSIDVQRAYPLPTQSAVPRLVWNKTARGSEQAPGGGFGEVDGEVDGDGGGSESARRSGGRKKMMGMDGYAKEHRPWHPECSLEIRSFELLKMSDYFQTLGEGGDVFKMESRFGGKQNCTKSLRCHKSEKEVKLSKKLQDGNIGSSKRGIASIIVHKTNTAI